MAGNMFQAALEMLDSGEHAALVTIVSAEGFVPVSAAGKLLVTSAGTLVGSSGSDVLDADIRAEASRLMATGRHSPRQLRVLEKDAVASGWYRQWTVELLIESLQEQGHELLRALVALENTGHRGTLGTILTEHAQYPAGRRTCLVCDSPAAAGPAERRQGGPTSRSFMTRLPGSKTSPSGSFALFLVQTVGFFLARYARIAQRYPNGLL